jgi:ligand-binding sensor domain-containing protein
MVLGLLACTSDSVREASADVDPELESAGSVAAVPLDTRLWCIHEDDQGDLWLGSNGAGVYRYDGEALEQFTTDAGLAGDTVRGIHDDGRGGLLVSTTAGVSRFDGEAWSDVEVVEHTGTDGWQLDPDDVWLVFAPGEGGPSRFDGERLHRLKLTESPALAAHRKRYPNSAYAPDGVYTVFEDSRGHVWFGTASVGLCRYDGESLAWMVEERLSTAPSGGEFGIRSIFEDSAGDFWICNTRQRFQFEGSSVTRDGFELLAYSKRTGLPGASTDDAPDFEYCHSIVEDAAGHLWMACGDRGVWKYDGESVTRMPIAGADGPAYALSLLIRRDGELWVTTLRDGLHRLEGDRWVPFRAQFEALAEDGSTNP